MFKLMAKVNANSPDINAEKPNKRAPKIVTYGVSDDIDINELPDKIINNNDSIADYFRNSPTEDIGDELKVKFKFRRRNRTNENTWVLEISPKLKREVVNKLNKLNIGWKACEFADYIHITRCYRCNGYGHIAKTCKQQSDSCGLCGQSHKTSDCNQSVNKLFCSNCDKTNKSRKTNKLATDHSCFSQECETLKRIKNIILSKTDYGY
jgi:hypothetical protein